MNELNKYNEKAFENIKHIDESGYEYWLARELMNILQYRNWQNFEKIIDDYKLTRYACYLIAQNGDSRKTTIALAQIYFAI